MANRKNYEFDMLVSAGYISEHSFNHKFGAVPLLSQNTTSSVWDVNDVIYPFDALTADSSAGDVVHITNDIDDAGLSITVQGLDSDYMETEDTILLSGTDTAGTVEFIRVNRAFATNGTNTENIDIRAGAIDGTIVARITADMGQTLMAVYTVPAHCTGYLHRGTATAQAGKDATGFMYIRYHGEENFRVGHTFEVTGAGGQYHYDFAFPIPIPAKSDIDVRMATRTNNGRFTAAFDILLVENDNN